MSAWILALLSLLQVEPSGLRTPVAPHALLVYVSGGGGQQATIEPMKRELRGIMQTAGFQVIYGDPHRPDAGHYSSLVVLELRGDCAMPRGTYRVERAVASGASLAETSVSDGAVMPFSAINCANLTRMIGPVLADEAGAQRDYYYGRAMARVAAHELYHVMMGSRDHAHEGLGRPSFTVADLLDERFGFDAAALAMLRQKSGDAPAESLTDR